MPEVSPSQEVKTANRRRFLAYRRFCRIVDGYREGELTRDEADSLHSFAARILLCGREEAERIVGSAGVVLQSAVAAGRLREAMGAELVLHIQTAAPE
jgi:hypothetical protein